MAVCKRWMLILKMIDFILKNKYGLISKFKFRDITVFIAAKVRA